VIRQRWTRSGERRYDVRLRDPSGAVYTRTFRTRREPEAFEVSERASRARGAWRDPRRAEQTLREVAGDWLDSNPAKRPSSRARDESPSERTSFQPSGTAPSGRSRRRMSNAASTNGRERWRLGQYGGSIRPSPRS
jgi:hypothetical protein